ncbi:penicillin acylase family protein [Algoriphagus sp. CAU 1675]|uniref:penicillin acylase family protein n=1 Tax=Algoriphagus sp. CAU 1675 TaxID=3032597 RepID=UPI0023DC07E6|nr:penicillin acylase family protein [Algoriphagus sp. CAU 1675]MDF2157411.1 penicillin acylase family protein [Algoriphagus sp. CAU 1675]
MMKKTLFTGVFSLFSLLFLFSCQPEKTPIQGLEEEVEVFRDENGINHIYAQNERDLFFAQGYLAAKDRLFQFELWRRQATGTLAEILGERELERDKGVRLFQFRGDKKTELSHYHPRGEQIVDAFVSGINTYIEEIRNNPELLPVEFQLLGIQPEPWTWQVVISRHQGLLQNVTDELDISRVVSQIGTEEAKKLYYFHPNEPILDIPGQIPTELLFKDILAPYQAFRKSVSFKPEDIVQKARAENTRYEQELLAMLEETRENIVQDRFSLGSNNWVISGKLTESGFPYMANDPHRAQAVPSLRYWVHLNAPGWNVVGGGEPVIPGVSIGHNDYGAWGLTIFQTDNEDLKVYTLNPENLLEYKYKGEWLKMTSIQDTISVKDKENVITTHYYTLHGPVTFIDSALHKAVAVQAAWLEPGGAPYLASLRMDQSKTWEEFRDACTYNHIPAENMIWADKEGNIGWQSTGIPPIRKGFSGLIASLGDGSQDWDGYLPIADRPHLVNPENGFIATANENVSPEDYEFPEALGFQWADNFRGERIREVLGSGQKFTLEDMGRLQNDYLSLPARQLVPHLLSLTFEDKRAIAAQDSLKNWDLVLDKNSIAGGIYVMWERKIRDQFNQAVLHPEIRNNFGSIQMTRILQWVEKPEIIFDSNPIEKKNQILSDSFLEALTELETKLGPDMKQWQYGQTSYKHALIQHPLSLALSPEWREKLDAGPIARGGYSYTPGANAYGDNNTSGASFRILVDTKDLEKTKGINTPGQSGNPDSRFYKNLFETWANDGYFQVFFDKEKIENSAVESFTFTPKE